MYSATAARPTMPATIPACSELDPSVAETVTSVAGENSTGRAP